MPRSALLAMVAAASVACVSQRRSDACDAVLAILHQRPTPGCLGMTVPRLAQQVGGDVPTIPVLVSWEAGEEETLSDEDRGWLASLDRERCQDARFSVGTSEETPPRRLRVILHDFTRASTSYAVTVEVQGPEGGAFATLLCGQLEGTASRKAGQWQVDP